MPIREAVARLDDAVGRFLGRLDPDNARVLDAVFVLNNEIGRDLRRSGEPALKEFQLKVNEVTRAAKRNDRSGLRAAMEKVRDRALELG